MLFLLRVVLLPASQPFLHCIHAVYDRVTSIILPLALYGAITDGYRIFHYPKTNLHGDRGLLAASTSPNPNLVMSAGGLAVVANNLESSDDLSDSVEADALEAEDTKGHQLRGRGRPQEASRGRNELLHGLDEASGILKLLPEGLVVSLEGRNGSDFTRTNVSITNSAPQDRQIAQTNKQTKKKRNGQLLNIP